VPDSQIITLGRRIRMRLLQRFSGNQALYSGAPAAAARSAESI
jgi:hypothetical protein